MALAVKKDMLVTLSVRMADMSGKILEESGPEGLTYLHGHGDIFPKLEAALEGRFPGEGFFIKLERGCLRGIRSRFARHGAG